MRESSLHMVNPRLFSNAPKVSANWWDGCENGKPIGDSGGDEPGLAEGAPPQQLHLVHQVQVQVPSPSGYGV